MRYPHTATLQTVTRSAAGTGRKSEAWNTKEADVPCRVQAVSATERTTNEKNEPIYTHVVSCDNRAIDQKADRWLYGSIVLEIKQVIPATDGRGIVRHVTCQCIEVR